jgi:hypothetical protein
MKVSTLLIMVTLSASCFAAPVHTAYDNPPDRAAQAVQRAYAAPVAPPAPDFAAVDDGQPQRWQHIALPKSRHLDRGFVAPNEHLQT